MRVFPNGSGLLLGLFLTFAAAWVWPNGALVAESLFSISDIAVVVIFLIQGWNLRAKRISLIWKDYPNLLVIHGFIFLVPLFFVLFLEEINFLPAQWIDGFIFLAILPTTISSCVVYTSIAGGDSDFALGHATLSNLLAVIWVPFAWLIFGIDSEIGIQDQWVSTGRQVFPQIFLLVLFPCFVGWIARKVFSKSGENKFDHYLKKSTFLCILFLAYLALSKSILRSGEVNFFNSLIFLLPYLLVFLVFHLLVSWLGTLIFSRNRSIQVAKFYCMSQKSLAMGLPLAGVLIVGESDLGSRIVCPLILYHFLQLLAGACLISRLKEWITRTC